MPAYFKGNPVFGPRGPSGPDGNPIGTVISFMGTEAPKDYLVCDGAEYSVSDYPDLADFFRQQFGAANHFGGDGAETFAVPDLRNLFLRGYHGGAEEQLSGDIGAKQEATTSPNIMTSGTDQTIGHYNNEGHIAVNNPDAVYKTARTVLYTNVSNRVSDTGNDVAVYYSSRPLNMAVLYCIKAVESLPEEYVYSAEERKIGTWIDGKPLYRRVITGKTSNDHNWKVIETVKGVDRVAALTWITATNEDELFFSGQDREEVVAYSKANQSVMAVALAANRMDQSITIIFEYTKITD